MGRKARFTTEERQRPRRSATNKRQKDPEAPFKISKTIVQRK